jgi:hypothetical protein
MNLFLMEKIADNQIEIVNTIKLLIYKENPLLLEKVDFDDDNVFLEPLLFAYFNSKKDNPFPKEMLEEIMQGYYVSKSEVMHSYSFNKKGIAYIPELGYYKALDNSYEKVLKIGDFEMMKEIHPVLERYFIETNEGHIQNRFPEHNTVWKDNYKELHVSIEVIKKHLPEFYKQLVFANKRIYLHDNFKILNFATVETLGMLYFYVLGKDNLIYFIEELVHQGSHNYLCYIVHNKSKYFKIDVENIDLKYFSTQEWDNRKIYSAFHGLYTVVKRLECFDILLSKEVFSGKEKHELLGRLSDQFTRFKTGIELMNLDDVYTNLGKIFHMELIEKGEDVENKYSDLKFLFDLSNLGIDFRYEEFCKLNPIEEFYIKETQGFFNF